MAFVCDGVGNISFPQWDTGVGDFTITGRFKTPSSFAFEAIMGDTAGTSGTDMISNSTTFGVGDDVSVTSWTYAQATS